MSAGACCPGHTWPEYGDLARNTYTTTAHGHDERTDTPVCAVHGGPIGYVGPITPPVSNHLDRGLLRFIDDEEGTR
jgi:hypothetical protein